MGFDSEYSKIVKGLGFYKYLRVIPGQGSIIFGFPTYNHSHIVKHPKVTDPQILYLLEVWQAFINCQNLYNSPLARSLSPEQLKIEANKYWDKIIGMPETLKETYKKINSFAELNRYIDCTLLLKQML